MKKILISFVIVFLAFFFRFNNLNWDENSHLHPDERFLTMVGTSMKLPTSINQFFDQKHSLMNPENIGYTFFVYGRLPLTINKYLATFYKLDNYNDFTILGRQLSAFFDLLTVILVIKIAEIITSYKLRVTNLHYWAGFFYAIAVLPIQLSHFFAVDTFLNFFMFGSFYFALRKKNILSSIFFGLAISCKVTALFILPLNLFFLTKTVFVQRQSLVKTVFIVILYFVLAYFTVRLVDPYYFQNQNIFDPTLSKSFVENIKSLKNMTVKNMDNWFPPMVQWLNKNTVQHSLVNNVVFGLGIPQAILTILGIILILISNFKLLISNPLRSEASQFLIFKHKFLKEKLDLFVILGWSVCFFTYQSIQVTPTLRYFIIIYPFLAIFAAFGIEYLINYLPKFRNKYLVYPRHFSYIFISISILILLLWPTMFSSIYSNRNSRIEASEWIYKNLPANILIVGESWDDVLPMGVLNNYGKQFMSDQLPVFDPDTDIKWEKMNDMLMKADYYVLSSNRGWGSIITVPKKYPKMSEFYKKLLSGQLQYKKINEFNSYPQIKFQVSSYKLQVTFPDQWSDEGFTVYDHPQVLIYKNEKHSSKTF